MTAFTAHVDSFTRDHLPPRAEWPDLIFTRPEFQYPERFNCASRLLDRHIISGRARRRCIVAPSMTWTYADLFERSNQIAHVLTDDLGVRPGNRVLLRGPNSPMLAACWFAVMKVGAVAVTTMPLYRASELEYMIEKAQIRHAMCDARFFTELERATIPARDFSTVRFGVDQDGAIERRMQHKPKMFETVETSAEDVALIGFTSGTTGKAKATMHFHRDVLAICDAFPKSVLRASPDDLFCGSPPLGFTFGLGGLLLFPLDIGAATLLLEKATPELLLEGIDRRRASVVFTAPIAYRAMAAIRENYDVSSLRKCVSAGESLPLPIWQTWLEKTGLKIIDGIGGTEMLHIFISSGEDRIKPGSTGEVVPGYEARIVDDDGQAVPAGTIGRLAVRGPTGCRYLDDPRQRQYVQHGWNFPGDTYRMDDEGYFWYVARSDDMIIASGYNISGPEVEEALLAHADVKECAVVGAPDPERHTHIVKAFVVLDENCVAGDEEAEVLQDFVKARIAPYKAPRTIEFVSVLPRTETGKLQRYMLRDQVKT